MFHKRFSHFRFISLLILSLTFFFTSCQNFLEGSGIKGKIEEKIAYANSEVLSLKIDIDDSDAGSVSPSGYISGLRVTDDFKISANISKKYEFLYWVAVNQKDESLSMEDFVSIKPKDEKETIITVDKFSNDILIKPVYALIPSLNEDSIYPLFVQNGSPWDSSISARFSLPQNKTLDIYSIRFTETEIADMKAKFNRDENSDVITFLYDDSGFAYAYVLYGRTYFKNISIVSNGESICEYFYPPEITVASINISPNLNPFTDEDGYKDIDVAFDLSGFYYTFNSSYKIYSGDSTFKWNYRISNTTSEQENIYFTVDKSVAGLMSPNVSGVYNTNGKVIALEFKEESGYKFIRWESSTDCVIIDNPTSSVSEARVIGKSEGNAGTIITAVTAERPSMIAKSPVYGSSGVPKDEEISLELSKEIDPLSFIFTETEISKLAIPDDDLIYNDKSQIVGYEFEGNRFFKNVSIYSGNENLNKHYLYPVLDNNGKTIKIRPDYSNLIEVESGKTKDLTVHFENGIKSVDDQVELDESGIQWNFRLNNNTTIKAKITVQVQENQGTVKILSDNGSVNNGDEGSYNIGSSLSVSFKVASSYLFENWTVVDTDTGNPIDSKDIKIENPENSEIKIYVNQAVSNVLVKINGKERPQISSVSDSNVSVVHRDRDLQFTFSKDIDESSFYFSKADKKLVVPTPSSWLENNGKTYGYVRNGVIYFKNIKITSEDVNYLAYYGAPTISGKVLTIPVNKTVQIPVTTTRDLKVTLSGEIVDAENVSLGNDFEYYYKVNADTDATVNIMKNNELTSAGIIDTSSAVNGEKSIGSVNKIVYNLNDGYQFLGWSCDSDAVEIEHENATSTYFTVKSEVESPVVNITASAAKRPTVNIKVDDEENDAHYCDSSLKVTFDTAVEEYSLNGVKIEQVITSAYVIDKSDLFDRTYENNILTLKPKSTTVVKPVSSTENYRITVPYSVHYLKNGKDVRVGDSEEDNIVLSYVIKNETKSKMIINNESVSIGDIKTLSYTKTSGYKFFGWDFSLPLGYSMSDKWEFTGDVSGKKSVILDGSYKVYAIVDDVTAETINVEVKDVLTDFYIKPKSYLIPAVESVIPYGTGSVVARDEPIKITFNTKVNSADITFSIKKKYDNTEYAKKFNATFNSVYNILTLTPKTYDAIPLDDNTMQQEIHVIVKNVYYQDGETVVSMEEPYSFSYVINKSTVNKVKVQFVNNSASAGGINLSGTNEYSIGDVVSLKYALNDGYGFNKWATSDNSYVTIEDVNSNDTTFAIKNYISSTVTVTADAYQIPNLTSYGPESSFAGVTYESLIELTLNKNLKSDSIRYAIKSTTGNVDYSSYYFDPIIKDNKISIKPKLDKLKTLISGTDYVDMIVNVSGSDIENKSFSKEWSFRLNSTREKIKPQIEDILVWRDNTKSSIEDDIISDYVELINDSISYGWNGIIFNCSTDYNIRKKIAKYNHIKDSVYIDIAGFDSLSGVTSYYVNETYIADNKLSKPESSDIINSTSDLMSGFLIKGSTSADSDYYYIAKSKYILKTPKDGLIRLDIYVRDDAGNVSDPVSYFVIKDTIATVPLNMVLLNGSNELVTEDLVVPGNICSSVGYYNNVVKDTFVPKREDDYKIHFDDTKFSNGISLLSNITDMYIGNNTSNYNNLFGAYNLNNKKEISIFYSYDRINWIDAVKNDDLNYIIPKSEKLTYVKIKSRDIIGNEDEKLFAYPPRLQILSYELHDKNYQGYKTYAPGISKIAKFNISGYDEAKNAIKDCNAVDFGYFTMYRYTDTDGNTDNKFRCETRYGNDIGIFMECFPVLGKNGIQINGYFKQQEYRPAGKYDIFILPFYIYSLDNKHYYWYGDISEPYTLNISYPGVDVEKDSQEEISAALTVTHVNEEITAAVSDLLPSRVKLQLLSPEPNTGRRTVKVSYEPEDFIFNSNFVYSIEYKTKDSDVSYYGACSTFEIESDYDYEAKMIAANASGGKKSIVCEYYDKDGNSTLYLDAKYDNKPPRAIGDSSTTEQQFYPNAITLGYVDSNYPSKYAPPFDISGMKKNDKGEVVLPYYIYRSKVQNTRNANNFPAEEIFTLEQLEDLNFVAQDVTYYKETSDEKDIFVNIQYDATKLEAGWYNIYFKLEDTNGNTSCGYTRMHYAPPVETIIPKVQYVAMQSDRNGYKKNIHFSFSEPLENVYNVSGEFYDQTKQEWINLWYTTIRSEKFSEIVSRNQMFGCSANKGSEKYDFPYAYNYIKKNDEYVKSSSYNYYYFPDSCFYRFYFSYSDYSPLIPVYVYPEYAMNNLEDVEYDNYGYVTNAKKIKQCPVKNIMMGSNGGQVYFDNPVLVHTYYASKDLGDDYTKWISQAIEVDPTVYTPATPGEVTTRTYMIDKSRIPSGNYYAVVAHFADGTSAVTSAVYRQ